LCTTHTIHHITTPITTTTSPLSPQHTPTTDIYTLSLHDALPIFRPNHETNINIIARRTGKDVNSHTVLDGIITTIMATIQRINIIGSREGSRNRRRLKANRSL